MRKTRESWRCVGASGKISRGGYSFALVANSKLDKLENAFLLYLAAGRGARSKQNARPLASSQDRARGDPAGLPAMSAPCLSRPLLSAGPLQTLSREAGLAKPEPGLSEKGKGWNGSGHSWREAEMERARTRRGARLRRRRPARQRRSAAQRARVWLRAADDELRCEDAGHPQSFLGIRFLQAQAAAAQKTLLTYI